MYARLVTINGADVDGALKYIEETVAPLLAQQKGFVQFGVSGDRSRGLVSAISVFETKADLDASESAMVKVRQEGVETFGGQAAVAYFEQVVLEVGETPPQPGCALRLTTYKMDPARIDEHIAWFKSEVVPGIMSTPGIRAVRNMVNRETGEGRVGVVYSDKASLEASEGDRQPRLAAARSRGIEIGEDDVLEILYARM